MEYESKSFRQSRLNTDAVSCQGFCCIILAETNHLISGPFTFQLDGSEGTRMTSAPYLVRSQEERNPVCLRETHHGHLTLGGDQLGLSGDTELILNAHLAEDGVAKHLTLAVQAPVALVVTCKEKHFILCMSYNSASLLIGNSFKQLDDHFENSQPVSYLHAIANLSYFPPLLQTAAFNINQVIILKNCVVLASLTYICIPS